MPRSRTGAVLTLPDGSIWARVRYCDDKGNRKERRRRARNVTDAATKLKKMIRALDDHGAAGLDDSMLFKKWLDYYEKVYIVAAESRDDHKVAGMRPGSGAVQ